MSDVTALMSAMQPHIRLNRARLFVLAALLIALVRFRTTNLARLCLALPGPVHESSAYRRLQRFFAQVPLGEHMLHDLLMRHAPDGPLLLALDRTEWKTAGSTHNLLVVGYLHGGVVVPLAWRSAAGLALDGKARLDAAERAHCTDGGAARALARRAHRGSARRP